MSVTILNYNYGRYLPKALSSVLSQTYPNLELFIIDDASTDDSLQVISPHLEDPRITLITHQHNIGYVGSLLEGSDRSTGKYMMVISADDYATRNDAIQNQVNMLEAFPHASFCFTAWTKENDAGNILYERRAWDTDGVRSRRVAIENLIHGSPVLHSGTLIRTDSYRQVGGYDSDLHYSVDTNMWLNLLMVGDAGFLATPSYAYRLHTANLSQSSGAMWVSTEEMLKGIDRAFRITPSPLTAQELARFRAIARRQALVAIPTLDVFSGRIRRGWLEYWNAARRFPAETITQKRTATLVARTILGDAAYQRIRAVAKR